MQPFLTVLPALGHGPEWTPGRVDSSLPSVLPVLHTLPLANATTDFSLSLTFFICKVSVASPPHWVAVRITQTV